MERRAFLKLLSGLVAGGAVASPLPVLDLWSDGEGVQVRPSAFHLPDDEFGQAQYYRTGNLSGAELVEFQESLADLLCERARACLNPGSRFQIRAQLPWNYGRDHGMAWYANQAMQHETRWERFLSVEKGYRVFDQMNGFYLLGQQVA